MNKVTTIRTNNLPRSSEFYDRVFAELGAYRVLERAGMIVWGRPNHPVCFALMAPLNGHPWSVASSPLIGLDATSPDEVDRMHARAVSLRARNEGDPDFQEDGMRRSYVGYFRDFDGNKLAVQLDTYSTAPC